MKAWIRRFAGMGIAAVWVAAGTIPASGAIVAEFTAGETTAEVDGWRGMAGDGWATNWGFGSNGGLVSDRTVLDTNPLVAGGGNYLSVELSQEYNPDDIRTRGTRVARQYTDYGPVALAQSHSISFLLRLDSGLADMNDFRVHDDNSSQLSFTGSNAASWLVRWTTGWDDFRFSDGGVWSYEPSSVWLYEGDAYRVTIDYTPGDSEAGTYVGTIENLDYAANSRSDGASSFTSGTLELAYDNAQVNGYLNFVSYLSSATASDPLREAEWSLDGIHIIPEPSGVLLLGVGGLLLAAIRRRKSG